MLDKSLSAIDDDELISTQQHALLRSTYERIGETYCDWIEEGHGSLLFGTLHKLWSEAKRLRKEIKDDAASHT